MIRFAEAVVGETEMEKSKEKKIRQRCKLDG